MNKFNDIKNKLNDINSKFKDVHNVVYRISGGEVRK